MSRIKILLVVLVALLILLELPGLQTVSSAQAGLSGTVKSSDGEPLEGVVVSARAGGQSFTTSVYTDQEGYYYFPTLDSGHYRTWAQAVGFQAGRAQVRLSDNEKVQQDFTMQILEDFSKQLSGAEWLTSLPEETPMDRQAKAILNSTCSGCHSINVPLQNRFDSEDWGLMLDEMIAGASSRFGTGSPSTTWNRFSAWRRRQKTCPASSKGWRHIPPTILLRTFCG